MINCNVKEFLKIIYIYICITKSLCCTVEINTATQLNFNKNVFSKSITSCTRTFDLKVTSGPSLLTLPSGPLRALYPSVILLDFPPNPLK